MFTWTRTAFRDSHAVTPGSTHVVRSMSLHGPHQGAPKSTTTSLFSRSAAATALSKVVVADDPVGFFGATWAGGAGAGCGFVAGGGATFVAGAVLGEAVDDDRDDLPAEPVDGDPPGELYDAVNDRLGAALVPGAATWPGNGLESGLEAVGGVGERSVGVERGGASRVPVGDLAGESAVAAQPGMPHAAAKMAATSAEWMNATRGRCTAEAFLGGTSTAAPRSVRRLDQRST